ncbi:MAG: tetratricopeptide repeat protein [Elusimicrobia bacterium]|nr:tetratricopeptide repeat protein [Elusimicrobiota bacterium]
MFAPPSGEGPRLPPYYWGLWGLALAAAFAPLAAAPFVYDDLHFLIRAPELTGPWPGLGAFFGATFGGGELEPLPRLLHWAMYRVAGEEAAWYRVSSLLLHAAVSVLLYAVGRPALGPRAAFWAAVLFSLFPAHVETLALSTFKKHILVAAAGLLMVLAARRPGPGGTAAACALYGAGLLCKESALILPALLFLAETASPATRPGPRRLARYAALGAVAAAYVAWRLLVAPRVVAPPAGGTLASHALTSAKLWLWYLPRFGWPFDSCLEHSVRPAGSGPGAWLWPALAAAAVLGGRLLWRRDLPAGAFAAWAGLGLLPFINLLPFLNFSLVADRYLYLASAGFWLGALRVARGAVDRGSRASVAALLLVALTYAGCVLRHATVFGDPMALRQRTAACAPENPRARGALGAGWLELGRLDAAREELEAAHRLAPDYDEATIGLATVYAKSGRVPEAIGLLERLRVEHPRALGNLAVMYQAVGKTQAARRAAQRAVELAPWDRRLRLVLGGTLSGLGRVDEAAAHLRAAAEDPELAARALTTLGDGAAGRGRLDEAAALYEEALAREPLAFAAVKGLAAARRRQGRPELAARALDDFAARLDKAAAEAPWAAPALTGLREALRRERKL